MGSLTDGIDRIRQADWLAERHVQPADLDHLMELARQVVSQPMQLRPGVEPTLSELASRHDLTLFTKGEHDEQTLKVDRSGLAVYFDRVVVTPEKDVAAYHGLVAEHGLDPAATWMVGNSTFGSAAISRICPHQGSRKPWRIPGLPIWSRMKVTSGQRRASSMP